MHFLHPSKELTLGKTGKSFSPFHSPACHHRKMPKGWFFLVLKMPYRQMNASKHIKAGVSKLGAAMQNLWPCAFKGRGGEKAAGWSPGLCCCLRWQGLRSTYQSKCNHPTSAQHPSFKKLITIVRHFWVVIAKSEVHCNLYFFNFVKLGEPCGCLLPCKPLQCFSNSGGAGKPLH